MQVAQSIVRHWLLNTAIECPRKLSDTVPVVRTMLMNVLAVPSACPEDYASGILALFDSGSIRAYFDEDAQGIEVEADRPTLESALQRRLEAPAEESGDRFVRSDIIHRHKITPDPLDLRWQLTAAGGEAWERLAQPDWNRYVTILTGEESGEAWSANFDLLMAEIGWCRELNGVEIDRNTVNLELLLDHPITYWKFLPVVHRAAFECIQVESHRPDGRIVPPEWFRQWCMSRSDWYKEPWKLSIWPTAS